MYKILYLYLYQQRNKHYLLFKFNTMNVTKKAHELKAAGIATTWSQAMKLAVAFIRTMNKINEGKAFAFIKKSTGERRVVNNPARYQRKGAAKPSNRVPKPHIIIFVDTDKGGTRSCDIRTLCA